MPNDQPFDQKTNQTDNNRCDDQHGHKNIHPEVDGGDGRIAPDHHEFAMGKVDDFHHAEHNRKARTDQDQRGNRIKHFDKNDDGQVHGCPFPLERMMVVLQVRGATMPPHQYPRGIRFRFHIACCRSD